MTLNGVMAVILRYFSEFTYLPGVLRKSSRSLSHLLMSSCTNTVLLGAANMKPARPVSRLATPLTVRGETHVTLSRSARREVDIWRTFSLSNAKNQKTSLNRRNVVPYQENWDRRIECQCQNFHRNLINSRLAHAQ